MSLSLGPRMAVIGAMARAAVGTGQTAAAAREIAELGRPRAAQRSRRPVGRGRASALPRSNASGGSYGDRKRDGSCDFLVGYYWIPGRPDLELVHRGRWLRP